MQLDQQLAAMHQALAASHQEIMGSKLREAHLAGQLHELEQQVMQALDASSLWLTYLAGFINRLCLLLEQLLLTCCLLSMPRVAPLLVLSLSVGLPWAARFH
jgi:hypothetical protein